MPVIWCLSGGGIKGAFEAGAAVALHLLEPRLAPDKVAGTSVGAINGLALAAFNFDEACGTLLNEFLRLRTRTDMYDLSSSIKNLLRGDPFEGVSESAVLRLADTQFEGLIALLSGAALGEIEGVAEDALIGAGIGFLVGGPLGAIIGGLIGGYVSFSESEEDLERFLAGLEVAHGLFTLGPIFTQMRKTSARIDFHQLKPARFESVALEDGNTYAIDETGALRVGLWSGRFPSMAVPLVGPAETAVLRGVLASAAIPAIFQPVVVNPHAAADLPFAPSFNHPTGSDLTLVDGGLRNILPILSTLDLMAGEPPDNLDLVIIATSRQLTAADPTLPDWPHFAEGQGNAYDYRPMTSERQSGAPLPSLLTRALQVQTRDGIDMGRLLLNGRSQSMTVIEATLSIIGTAQVDPGLIRIWAAYGYLRAADALRPGGLERDSFYWSSDWITAARKLIWTNEDRGGPVELMLDRTLYLAIRALSREREVLRPSSVPPTRAALLAGLLAGFEVASTPELVDLTMDGSSWMLRDAKFRDGFDVAGADPFAEIRGVWPRTQASESAIRILDRLSWEVEVLIYPDPHHDSRPIRIRPGAATYAVQEAFRLAGHNVPTGPFPLWEVGAAFRRDDGSVIVGGIDPFTNRYMELQLTPGAVGGAPFLAMDRVEVDGPVNDPVVGVLDPVGICGLAPLDGGPTLPTPVVRGRSGFFWVWVRTRIGSAWRPVERPRDVASGRRDVPNEGHSVTSIGGRFLIASQTNRGVPLLIESNAGGQTSRWEAVEIAWPGWFNLGRLNRAVIGGRLPVVATGEGGTGTLQQVIDGRVWWLPFRGSHPLRPELVTREGPLPFPLTGISQERDLAVLAGMDGGVLRRFIVKIDPVGPDHEITECEAVDLVAMGYRHYGRALAAPAGDVTAIVPVQMPDDRLGLVWVDGCGTGPPRIIPGQYVPRSRVFPPF